MLLVYGFFLLISSFVLHVLWWHIRPPKHHTNTLLLIFTCTPIVASFILRGVVPDWLPHTIGEYLQLFIFYVPMSLVYITLYSALELRSVALILLQHVEKAGAKGIATALLKQEFNSDHMLQLRLSQMIKSRMVYADSEYYVLSPKGKNVAYFFTIASTIFGIPSGG